MSQQDRIDPYRSNRFQVNIGDDSISFREVTFPEMTVEPVEYREGNDSSTAVKKIPGGLHKFGNINLKRGITDSTALYEWYNDGIMKNDTGKLRRNIEIVLFDEGKNAVKQWNCINCWPIKYKAADMNATNNEIAIEELELVTEGIELQ